MAISLSGSLEITGSIYATGGITGSFSGTATSASYALIATSASYAANATSASYALVSTSSSYAANADLLDSRDSLTFANTGSNNFVGTQNINGAVAITGSLTTTGAITAQTLNVQQVTSSIVYSSGSNVFGNSVSNTQSMTGSVGISGSLSVNGVSTLSGVLSGTSATFSGQLQTSLLFSTDGTRNVYLNPAADFGNGGLPTIQVASNHALQFATNNTLRLTIASTGAATFSVASGIYTAVNATSPNTSVYYKLTPTGGDAYYLGAGVAQTDDFAIYNVTRSKNYLTILGGASGGNVGIGTSSPFSLLQVTSGTTMTTSGGDQASNATIEGANVAIGASFTGQLAVLTNSAIAADSGGSIVFGSKYSGNAFAYYAAIKTGKDDSTSGNYGGYLQFATRANGGNVTERMRITSGGNVGIGTASPATILDVRSSSSATIRVGSITHGGSGDEFGNLEFYWADPDSAGVKAKIYAKNTGNVGPGGGGAADLLFATETPFGSITERMRITSGGIVGIGTATPASFGTQRFLVVGAAAGQVARFTDGTNADLVLDNPSAGITRITAQYGTDGTLVFAKGTGFSETMRITSGGNVGIGNTGYSNTRLTITGIGTTGSNYGLVVNNSSNSNLFWVRDDALVSFPKINDFTTGNSPNAWINPASSYGIYINTSSIRYKKDISNYDKGIDIVNQLRPVYYKGISEVDGDKQFVGLIAEEIHDLGLIEFVNYNEEGLPNSLSYPNMIALAFKAIQEQQSQIETLKLLIK